MVPRRGILHGLGGGDYIVDIRHHMTCEVDYPLTRAVGITPEGLRSNRVTPRDSSSLRT